MLAHLLLFAKAFTALPLLRQIIWSWSPSEYHTFLRGGFAFQSAPRTRMLSEHVAEDEPTITYNAVMSIICIFCAAIAAGLTQGLLSINPLEMSIKVRSGTDEEKRQAAKILPLIAHHHRLLVTLMLFNASAFEALPLFLNKIVPEWLAIILSVTGVLLFGEILPSAIFTGPNQYFIAATLAPLVWVLQFIFSPVAVPLAYALDTWLGHDDGLTIFNRKEIFTMMQIQHEEGAKRGLSSVANEEVKIIGGALNLSNKTVESVMTKEKDVYMLSVNDTLNITTLSEIFNVGYSRVPIYQTNRNDIIGLLLVKDLLFVDPEDEIPIKNFMQLFGRPLQSMWPDQTLTEALLMFKKTHTHMALVKDVDNKGVGDPFYYIKGIITMEDILEDLLGHEINDETDDRPAGAAADDEATTDNRLMKRSRMGLRQIEFAELKRIASTLVKDESLSNDEVRAVTSFLESNVKQVKACFAHLHNAAQSIEWFVRNSKLLVVKPDSASSSSSSSGSGSGSSSSSPKNSGGGRVAGRYLYHRGQLASRCTLILSGKVKILSGKDEFEVEKGPWSILAADVLIDEAGVYAPDFSAQVVSEEFRCVFFERSAVKAAASGAPINARRIGSADTVTSPGALTASGHSISHHRANEDSSSILIEIDGASEGREPLLGTL